MRRRLVVAVALALAGTLAFPSVAVPLTTGDRVTEDVHLAPSDSPNGEYASLVDGDLVVDLTGTTDTAGVNDDGVTTVSNVFRVRYNGTRFVRVWFTHGSDSVTFHARGRPIQTESEAITLEPNDSVGVGLTVDTRGETDGLIDDLTLHAATAESGDETRVERSTGTADRDDRSRVSIRSSAPTTDTRHFVVTNAPAAVPIDLDPDALAVGHADEMDLVLDGLIVTGEGGSMSIDVTAADPSVTGALESERNVRPIGAAELEDEGTVGRATVRFSLSRATLQALDASPSDLVVYRTDADGWSELDAEVGSEGDDRVGVTVEPSGFSTFAVAVRTPEPDLRIEEATFDRRQIRVGGDAVATARVHNPGNEPVERSVAVTRDGTPVTERRLDVAAGEVATVRFTVSPDTPGRYDLTVAGTDTAELVVVSGTADASSSDVRTPSSSTVPTTEPNARTEADPSSTPTTGTGPGLGFVTGLLGLLVTACFFGRRNTVF